MAYSIIILKHCNTTISLKLKRKFKNNKLFTSLLLASILTGAWTAEIIYISLNIFQIIAVQNPIFYSTRVTVKHSCVICGLAWLASITFGILVVMNAHWNSAVLAKFGFLAATTLLVFYFIVAVATYGIIMLKAKIT